MIKVRITKMPEDKRLYIVSRSGRDGKGTKQALAETESQRKTEKSTVLAEASSE